IAVAEPEPEEAARREAREAELRVAPGRLDGEAEVAPLAGAADLGEADAARLRPLPHAEDASVGGARDRQHAALAAAGRREAIAVEAPGAPRAGRDVAVVARRAGDGEAGGFFHQLAAPQPLDRAAPGRRHPRGAERAGPDQDLGAGGGQHLRAVRQRAALNLEHVGAGRRALAV